MDRFCIQLATNSGVIEEVKDSLTYEEMMAWYMYYLGKMSFNKRQYKVLVFYDV